MDSSSAPTGSQITYTYDPAGNITAMAVTPGGGTTPVLTSDPAPWGQVGVAFMHTLTSSRTPATFAATGLPPGLSLTSGTGVIAGSPTTAGRYPVSVTVTSGAFSSTSSITIQIRPAASTPVILIQPQGYTTTLGQMASLFVDADGTPPLSFQWRKNGNPISGATGMSFVIPSFAAADAGNYSVVVTNAAGSATSSSTRVDYIQPWAIGGESYGLPLTFTGSPAWFSQSGVTYEGLPTMQSGAIGDGGLISFSTTVTGPGEIAWKWKVSSQQGSDGVVVHLNGSNIGSITGEQDWQAKNVLLNAGSNTITWYYVKDGNSSGGLDRGWVADVTFTPGWQLVTGASGNGAVSRSPDQTTFADGTSVTLTATPGNGYYFDGWTGGATSTSNPRTLTASSHQSITAVFKQNLGPAVGAPALNWRTGGNADWRSQFYVTQNDGIAAQAGTITNGQSSWLETTVTGPGTLAFAWKVSSQSGSDFLTLSINGAPQASISGEQDWEQRTVVLGMGVKTLRWTYSKDGFVNGGQDTAWLDGIVFTPIPPSTNADLESLTLSSGTLSPIFAAGTVSYSASVPNAINAITLTAATSHPEAMLSVNSVATVSGNASAAIPLNLGSNVISIAVTAQDGSTTKTYTIQVNRELPPLGEAEPGYDPQANNIVWAAAIQPNGQVIIGGDFTSIGGVSRNRIARLNADGSLDSDFDPDADGQVRCISIQADGRILIGGNFFTVDGNSRIAFARLNADGSIDASFNPVINDTINSIAVQPDGRIMIAGFFTSVNGTTRNRIARLNANGSLDTGFNPDSSAVVWCIAQQNDGRTILGGSFLSMGGVARSGIARINANGSLDTGFNADANNWVLCSAVQADGKILIGGDFTNISGTSRNYVARLNANGTLDAAFDPGANSRVNSLSLQADGRLIIAGGFTSVGSTTRNAIARLNADGSVDAAFNPGANAFVYCSLLQADGRLIVGGSYTSISGSPRSGIARLANGISSQALSVSSPSRVEWLRGGAAPECQSVSFESSINGGVNWTALGVGTRIAGGWEINGLSLSGNGQIRARGRATGGIFNGSNALYEATTSFQIPTPEIVVEQPAGSDLTDGVSSLSFGNTAAGTPGMVRVFTIKNTGGVSLNISSIDVSGGNAGDFIVNTNGMSANIPAAGGNTTFSVAFIPSAVGGRSTTLRVQSNDADESPFEISLIGTGLTATPGTLAFTETLTEAQEDSGTLNARIIRTGGSDGTVTVRFSTADGTAKAPADYIAIPDQLVTFAHGETEKQVMLNINNDSLSEAHETFTIGLKTPNGGAALGSLTTATVRIIDSKDTISPVTTITTPAANARVMESLSIKVTGTAKDDKGMNRVETSLNGSAFANALASLDAAGQNASFTAPIQPTPGINTFSVRSYDKRGNVSSTVTRVFTYVVMRPLALTINPATGGMVIFTPALVAGKAELGVTYTLKATPKAGFGFDLWTTPSITGLPAESSTVTLVMQEGLAITASFLPSPFSTSNYTGLATPGMGTSGHGHIGLLTGMLAPTGIFTGKVNFGGTLESFTATFHPGTRRSVGGTATLTYDLNVDLTGGTDKITGAITRRLGASILGGYDVDADKAVFNAANRVPASLLKAGNSTQNGIYTLAFRSKPSQVGLTASGYPQGDGFGTLTLTPLGVASLTGILADGTSITASAPISKVFRWPLAVIIKSSPTVSGMTMGGFVQFDTTQANSDLTSPQMPWFRPAFSKALYYQAGWPTGIFVDLVGSKYTAPPPGSAALPGLKAVDSLNGNAILTIENGKLGSPFIKSVNISTTSAVTKIPTSDSSFTLSLAAASGGISGSFSLPSNASLKPAIRGVLLQKGTNAGGHGFFLSLPATSAAPGESGSIKVRVK